jgi:hypothetical protein
LALVALVQLVIKLKERLVLVHVMEPLQQVAEQAEALQVFLQHEHTVQQEQVALPHNMKMVMEME